MFPSLIEFQKRKLMLHSLIRFISGNSVLENSFTISYLVNSCGLSQQKAISISKRVHFDSPTNPDSVLTLFKNNGFSDINISKLTGRFPWLLLSSADKTLKPKFDFLNSKGFSGADLANALCQDARVLMSSLENTIIPSFEFLKSIVGTDEKVITVLKKSLPAIRENKRLATNIKVLRGYGVPDSNIAKLLASQPRVFRIGYSRFIDIVEDVKKMKFDPSRYLFLIAIHGLAAMSRSSLEAKFGVYKKWGLSEDEVQCAFRKNPYCMMLSEESIMLKMDYFVNRMGCAPSIIAKQPNVVLYSVEGRIIPRCSVIQVLVTNGLVKVAPTLSYFLGMTENMFFNKYISRFDKEVPELLSIYQGKGKINGLDSSSSSSN